MQGGSIWRLDRIGFPHGPGIWDNPETFILLILAIFYAYHAVMLVFGNFHLVGICFGRPGCLIRFLAWPMCDVINNWLNGYPPSHRFHDQGHCVQQHRRGLRAARPLLPGPEESQGSVADVAGGLLRAHRISRERGPNCFTRLWGHGGRGDRGHFEGGEVHADRGPCIATSNSLIVAYFCFSLGRTVASW